MISARVAENIITPYFFLIWKDIALNVAANMGAPSCATRFTIHNSFICSVMVNPGSNYHQLHLNDDVDANTFFQMFDCIYFRKCPCVMGLQVQRPVPELIPRVVTLTTRRTLFDGVNTPSCPTS